LPPWGSLVSGAIFEADMYAADVLRNDSHLRRILRSYARYSLPPR
jgi:hypothetical protein